jgi:hypothetical protein
LEEVVDRDGAGLGERLLRGGGEGEDGKEEYDGERGTEFHLLEAPKD